MIEKQINNLQQNLRYYQQLRKNAFLSNKKHYYDEVIQNINRQIQELKNASKNRKN